MARVLRLAERVGVPPTQLLTTWSAADVELMLALELVDGPRHTQSEESLLALIATAGLAQCGVQRHQMPRMDELRQRGAWSPTRSYDELDLALARLERALGEPVEPHRLESVRERNDQRAMTTRAQAMLRSHLEAKRRESQGQCNSQGNRGG